MTRKGTSAPRKKRVAAQGRRRRDAESGGRSPAADKTAVDAGVGRGDADAEALRENEARLRLMLDQLPAIVWTTDRELRLTAPAGAALAGTGIEGRQAIGHRVGSFMTHRRQRDLIVASHRRALKGERVTYELRWDGHALQCCVEPLRDGDGEIVGCLGVALDISERARAEEAVRASELSLVEAQRVAHVGSWSWDIASGQITWSDELFRIFGREPGGKTPSYEELATIYTPASWELHAAAVERATTTGEPYELELELVRPDGSPRFILARGEAARDGAGRVAGLRGTALDITERRKAQEESSRLSLIVQSATDAIVSRTLDGILLDWNRGAERLFGWTAKEVRGRSLALLFPPDRLAEAEWMLARTREGRALEQFETVRLTKDGRRIDVSITQTPIRDSGGAIVGAASIVRDIGERKRAAARDAALGRLLRTVAEVDQLLVREDQDDALLQGVCRVIVEVGGYPMAWIGVPDPDTGRLVPAAAFAQGHRHQRTGDRLTVPAACTEHASRAAIGQRTVVGDTPHAGDAVRARRGTRADPGYQSSIVIPLLLPGQLHGVLAVHSHEREGFAGEAVPLLEETAGNLSHTLATREAERQRGLAEESLRRAHDELEARVAERTEQLLAANEQLRVEAAERERLLDQLAAERARLKLTVDCIPVAVVVADEQARVQLSNPAATALFAQTLPRAGRPGEPLAYEFRHRDGSSWADRDLPLVRSALAGETVESTEIDLLTRGGDLRHLLVSSAPLRGAGGSITGAVCVYRDITAVTRAQEELRQQQAFTARLIDSSVDGILAFDRDGRYTVWNPGMERISGVPAESVVGRHPADVFPFLAELGELDVMGETLAGGTPISSDRPFSVGESGRQGFFEAHYAPLLDDHGAVAGGLAIVRDTSERKRAEDGLREALLDSSRRQEEVAALLDATQAVLVHLDFEHASRAIFDRCKSIVGATGGYVALSSADGSENELTFLDAGDRPCSADPKLPMPVRGLRAEAYRTGRTVCENEFASSEWSALLPPGHCTLDNALFAPIVLTGTAVGLIGLANKPGGFDANDARLATAFSELAAVALSASRARRTLEESERRLRVSLKEKEVLLKEIHHRVKNNLQIVASMLSLQAGTGGLQSLRESQDRVRTLALVHEKLYGSHDLAHIPFGQYVHDLAGYLLRSYASTAERVCLREELDDMHLDLNLAVPLGLIVNELVSNALKHAFTGRDRGTITLVLRNAENGRRELAVADDGVGFPAGLDHRATESLGLQLVEVLTAQLGGSTTLERGHGTRFTIRF